MDKTKLSRYFWLKHEIEHQLKRLDKLEKRQALSDETVGDTVNNYRTGKGIPIRIEGIPEEGFNLPVRISVLKLEIERNIRESEELVVEIEKFVQGIEEPKLRELIRCRYIDCMNWEEVGRNNYLNSDYARQLIRGFIKDL